MLTVAQLVVGTLPNVMHNFIDPPALAFSGQVRIEGIRVFATTNAALDVLAKFLLQATNVPTVHIIALPTQTSIAEVVSHQLIFVGLVGELF